MFKIGDKIKVINANPENERYFENGFIGNVIGLSEDFVEVMFDQRTKYMEKYSYLENNWFCEKEEIELYSCEKMIKDRVRCFVFTNNRDKANSLFNELRREKESEFLYERRSRDDISLTLKNGDTYEWKSFAENLRAVKCNKAYIDGDIDCKMFNMIMGCCMYCEDEDIIYI